MSFNKNVNETVAGESRSSSVAVVGLGCLARVAAPELGLSRVRLSVTEPRCCFPCLGKRREVASFSFKEGDWTKAPDGQYESSVAYSLVDLASLQRLHEDLPVKVKWWAGRRKGKTRLDDSLGDVLHLLRSWSPLTLQVVADPQQVTVCWDATDASWIFPGAWTSEDDVLDEEDLKLVNALNGPSYSTEGRECAIPRLPFHMYINESTGRFITLPVHEEVEGGGWTFPGAWTSQDDELDHEDLKLLHALNRAAS